MFNINDKIICFFYNGYINIVQSSSNRYNIFVWFISHNPYGYRTVYCTVQMTQSNGKRHKNHVYKCSN